MALYLENRPELLAALIGAAKLGAGCAMLNTSQKGKVLEHSINITNPNGTALFDQESIYDFENGQPKTRGVFTATHNVGPFTLMGRANYYGDYSVSNFVTESGVTEFRIQELGQEVLFEFEVSYDVTEQAKVSVGVRNAFDEYPDKGEYRLRETTNGRIYRSDSVVDWMGCFYYGKIKYTF